MRSIWKWLKGESGQSTIIIAISLVVLCGFAAMAIDLGRISVEKGQLQNAADAAALAGGQNLPSATTAKSTAVQYAALNGVTAANTTVTTPYNSSASKIEVVCKGTVDYTFARIFGFTSREVSARAVAQKTGMSGGPFGYAVFSGSTSDMMQFATSSLDITGSAHANADFQMSGSLQKISGNAEAVKSFASYVSSITIGGTCQGSSITIYGSTINVPTRVTSAATIIAMPDFTSDIRSEAAAAGTLYTSSKTYIGTTVNVDSSVYVDGGSLTFSGSSFSGQGCMVATGDIQFNGSMIKANSGSSVCLYSKNGGIQLNTSGVQIDGILYAPNGTIQINASNVVINGRVIAKKVLIYGSNVKIVASASDLNSLPGGSVSLVE